jgi:integrase
LNRAGSAFYWIRHQKPDGTWGGKSSGIRRDAEGAVRRLKQALAHQTLQELHFTSRQTANRFSAWVPHFLDTRYPNRKTVIRYGNAWAAISVYLDFCKIISPSEVSYQVCVDYPAFRTKPPRELMRARSHNTALTELKVFSAIMQEAVRRGYAVANPCVRLGLKRRPAKVKPEITVEEERKIEAALEKCDPWMRDCWKVAMRQGCRLSVTDTALDRIDLEGNTITFLTKGARTHTAPLHADLRSLVEVAHTENRQTLVNLPQYAAKKWHQFFRRLGLGHLSFHSTRVTVVTRLARAGHPIYQTKAYVGHASDTVHAIYQRLTPMDVRHLCADLSSRPAESQDVVAAIPAPTRPKRDRQASQSRPTSSASQTQPKRRATQQAR